MSLSKSAASFVIESGMAYFAAVMMSTTGFLRFQLAV